MPMNERGLWTSATLDERGQAIFGSLDERGQAVFGVATAPQTGTTYTGSGTIQGTSNVSAVEKSILKALGTLQGFSSLTSQEKERYTASGTLQGFSSLSSGETLILFTGNVYSASGTIQGVSTLNASEKIIYKEISAAVGYSDSSVHEIVTLLASGIAQGYSNVLLVDKTEVIAQVSLIGKQRIEVTLIGKQKLDTTLQGKQRITINLKGVMK